MMMPSKYALFCTMVLGFYAYANHKGIVYSAMLSSGSTAQKAANIYHK